MWRATPLLTALAAAVALAALTACGGDDPPAPVTPTATATVAVTTTATPTPTTTPSPTVEATPTAMPSSGAEPCDVILVDGRYGCRGVIEPLPPPTPEPAPCESVDCIRENLCRGAECMEAEPDPRTCRLYDCIETVPNAFERRIFEPGERIDWPEGVFFFQIETGRTEAYRVKWARDGQGFAPGGAWVEAWGSGDWRLLLHRESGQAWRWAEGAQDTLLDFLKKHLDVDYPACVAFPEPRAPLGQAGWFGVPCEEAAAWESAQGETTCQGRLSPDGRYVAQQWGEPVSIKYVYPHAVLHTVPSIVFADAKTCEPIYRVLNAYAYEIFWEGQWLSNSEGFVLGVEDGYAVAPARPGPELVYLPPVPIGANWSKGPVPAPTGDGRYFAYDFAGVYDSQKNQWILTGFNMPWGPFVWGETHEEMRYQVGYWGEGSVGWSLSEPRIEFPPFEEVASHVATTGSCLNLRKEPGSEAAVLGCLPNGTRVTLVVPPREAVHCMHQPGFDGCLPATYMEYGSGWRLYWVYIRAADETEGWVAYARINADDEAATEVYLDRVWLP